MMEFVGKMAIGSLLFGFICGLLLTFAFILCGIVDKLHDFGLDIKTAFVLSPLVAIGFGLIFYFLGGLVI